MSSRRLLKAAEAIREVVGLAIVTELRDPRIQDVTVTFVEVAPDMRLARVHVSVMGDDRQQQLSLHGLQNSAGFLQHKISKRIDTRYTPKLKFVLDKGIKNATRVTQILKDVLPDEAQAEETDVDGLHDERPDHEVAHDALRSPTEIDIKPPQVTEANPENTDPNEEVA